MALIQCQQASYQPWWETVNILNYSHVKLVIQMPRHFFFLMCSSVILLFYEYILNIYSHADQISKQQSGEKLHRCRSVEGNFQFLVYHLQDVPPQLRSFNQLKCWGNRIMLLVSWTELQESPELPTAQSKLTPTTYTRRTRNCQIGAGGPNSNSLNWIKALQQLL